MATESGLGLGVPPLTRDASEGGVVWITGYSSAGKTTVARKVEARLRHEGVRTIFLDGDNLRAIFGNKWRYDREERIELAKVYFRLCSHIAAQGATVILAAVAMYYEVGAWVRENVPRSVQVLLDVPAEERRARDLCTKQVYVTDPGLEEKYDVPSSPDLTIANHGAIDAEAAASEIIAFVRSMEGRDTDRGRTRHWENFYQSGSAVSHPSPFAQDVVRRLEPRRSILEVGCGNGRDAAFFANCGHQVLGVDKSVEAIEYCERHHRDLSGTRFLAGSTADVSSNQRGGFDVVYSRFCIHAMTPSEEAEFLTELVRLTAPGASLFIECRSINDLLARQGEVLSPTERIAGHYRRFIVVDELVAAVEAAGFSVVESIEGRGLAKFDSEDPVVIRLTARRRDGE